MEGLIPDLSIIIINYDTKDLLKDCLNSIRIAENSFPLEIIVVDNNSSDGSVQMCKIFFPFVKIIENVDNVGFGKANNQGIAACNSDLVLLLNSDTVLFENTLEEMVRRMASDSSIAILGCRLIYPDGKIQASCSNFPNLINFILERLLLHNLTRRLPRVNVEPPYIESERVCDWLFGACLLVRKSAVQSVGLFDPGFWMYEEEMELCYRIRKAGWKVLYYPKTKVIHLGPVK